jgi:hypothetical protein
MTNSASLGFRNRARHKTLPFIAHLAMAQQEFFKSRFFPHIFSGWIDKRLLLCSISESMKKRAGGRLTGNSVDDKSGGPTAPVGVGGP